MGIVAMKSTTKATSGNLPRLHEYLAAQLDMSEKTQREIAAEIGYDKPNIITMFKQGITKVPLTKIAPLARALRVDPVYMMRLALNEYAPETLAAIEDVMGVMVSTNEKEILEVIRTSTNHADPHMSTAKQRKELTDWAARLI